MIHGLECESFPLLLRQKSTSFLWLVRSLVFRSLPALPPQPCPQLCLETLGSFQLSLTPPYLCHRRFPAASSFSSHFRCRSVRAVLALSRAGSLLLLEHPALDLDSTWHSAPSCMQTSLLSLHCILIVLHDGGR